MTLKTINQFENPNLYFYRKKGVFILGTKRPGNAAVSRFRRMDIILEIDGEAVNSLEDVKRIHKRTLDRIETKTRILFKIMRNGLKRQLILDFARDYERK